MLLIDIYDFVPCFPFHSARFHRLKIKRLIILYVYHVLYTLHIPNSICIIVNNSIFALKYSFFMILNFKVLPPSYSFT